MSEHKQTISLKISEIFFSLQGETTRAGLPTVFIRLTGCPLRCRWCDTRHAYSGGRRMTLDAILQEAARFDIARACVTGGEPLAQQHCHTLLKLLCDAGYDVSLETSGAFDIAAVDPRISRIVDLKAPGSGEESRNHWPNLALLNERDELKFVLADRHDYDWACEVITRQKLAGRCPLLFSAVQDSLEPRQLAEWIIADRLPVRFQMQLHKQLWGNQPGR